MTVIPNRFVPKVILQLFFVSAVITLTGCSPTARRNVAAIATGATQGAAGSAEVATAKLMLFGGIDHRTYLGCLNCSQYDADSVFNQYGQHGSPYSSESVWNRLNEYGSEYSSYSACNPYATDPPAIVDSTGKYYGRLTLNAYHSELGVGANYYDWLKGSVCRSN